jgi:hypothetical protein
MRLGRIAVGSSGPTRDRATGHINHLHTLSQSYTNSLYHFVVIAVFTLIHLNDARSGPHLKIYGNSHHFFSITNLVQDLLTHITTCIESVVGLEMRKYNLRPVNAA